jgi:hypothetical protein
MISENSPPAGELNNVSQPPNPPILKWLVAILAVALVASGMGLIYFNNRITDLSGRVDAQSLELTALQNEKANLEETIKALNATLISTQKTPLVEVSLNALLTSAAKVNNTIQWMWILDSQEARSVDIPSSMLETEIRFVSQDDVKAKANGTLLFSLDEIRLTDSDRGLVKFSRWYVINVAGVPSAYSAERTTYYLARRAGNWVITGVEGAMEDYFRAIPIF